MSEVVGKIPLDNPIFRVLRQAVFQMDNALFNHNGSAGPGYRPTQYMLVLPYFAALATMVYYIYWSFTKNITETQAQAYLWRGGAILLGANLLLMLRHALGLPGILKKLLYLVFTVVVTGVFYAVTAVLLIWLAACFFIIIVGAALFGAAFGGGGSSSRRQTTTYRETTVVDDGSLFGKTLSREDGGNWHDGATEYEETSGGFRRK